MSDYGEIQGGGDGGDDGGFGNRPDPYQQQPAQYGQQYGVPSAGGPPPGALAGFWIRFGAAFLDGILLGVVAGILTAPLGDGSRALVQGLLAGAYFTFLHSTKAGQTLGMRLCGLRVVDVDTGGQVDPGRAAGRWLMSYVSGLAIGIGYLWMLWDSKNQTWHDKVANTLVVRSAVVPAPTTSLTER